MIPENLKYMESHEWARREDDIATVGISDYAQSEIQDIVYVELPEIGTEITQKTEFGGYRVCPKQRLISTRLLAAKSLLSMNQLLDAPEQVNDSPYDDGWMLKIRMTDANRT